MREINLDGAEISVIKAIGLAGSDVTGEVLLERLPSLGEAELIDTIKGLVSLGYVESDRTGLRPGDEFKTAVFQVNSGYIRDLREALDPRAQQPVRRRVRRE